MGGFRDFPLMNITHQKWQDVTSAMYDGTLWHLPCSNSFSGSSHLFALKAKAAMLSQGKAHMSKNWGQPLLAVLYDSTYNRYQPTASKEPRTSVQPPSRSGIRPVLISALGNRSLPRWALWWLQPTWLQPVTDAGTEFPMSHTPNLDPQTLWN